MILDIVLLILSILLTTAILIQARGSGLGAGMGGDGSVYRTKRGVEKQLHRATVILAILFFGTALANVLYNV